MELEVEDKICDDCGEIICGFYEEDEFDGEIYYTCLVCSCQRQDGADLDNSMGCS